MKKTINSIVIVAVYVDDILVTVGNNLDEIISPKTYLDSIFKIKDLGFLHYFLGLEFDKTKDGMVIHQHKFIMELLEMYSMNNSKPVSMPLPTKITLLPTMSNPLSDPTLYRQLIGKLNFLLHNAIFVFFNSASKSIQPESLSSSL